FGRKCSEFCGKCPVSRFRSQIWTIVPTRFVVAAFSPTVARTACDPCARSPFIRPSGHLLVLLRFGASSAPIIHGRTSLLFRRKAGAKRKNETPDRCFASGRWCFFPSDRRHVPVTL